jgi:hypothetical protein
MYRAVASARLLINRRISRSIRRISASVPALDCRGAGAACRDVERDFTGLGLLRCLILVFFAIDEAPCDRTERNAKPKPVSYGYLCHSYGWPFVQVAIASVKRANGFGTRNTIPPHTTYAIHTEKCQFDTRARHTSRHQKCQTGRTPNGANRFRLERVNTRSLNKTCYNELSAAIGSRRAVCINQ